MTQADRAIVTVRLEATGETCDVEVPVNVPAAPLGMAIAQALGWPTDAYVVWAEPPGRALADDETLAAAGAWEGARLMLRVGARQPKHPTPTPRSPATSGSSSTETEHG